VSYPEPLSIRQFTARDQTILGIRALIRSEYNFPTEAANSVVALHSAVELLLSERTPLAKPSAKKLIDGQQDIGEEQRALLHWLRESRNRVVHEGTFQPESKADTITTLTRVLPVLGALWVRRLAALEKHFTAYEASLLSGQVPGWQAVAEAFSASAIPYSSVDPEAAVDMANHSYGIALRGFAQAWRIPYCETASLHELRRQMDADCEREDAHPSWYDDAESPHNAIRNMQNDDLAWFDPPMTLASLVAHAKWSDERAALIYSKEIRDAVVSYATRVPLWGLRSCLASNWPAILDHMRTVAPDIEIPAADWQSDAHCVYCVGSVLLLPIDDPAHFSLRRPSDYWRGPQLRAFREIVESFYGPLPPELQL
jgi:hypothetical protein